MAEATDTLVQDTQQPRNCVALQECGAEEKYLGGVGNTTTNHLAETTNGCQHGGGSSPGKVRMHFNLHV